MGLFQLDQAELRERFVRACFAKADGFANAEIEAWLGQQRTAVRPNATAWEGHLKILRDHRSSNELKELLLQAINGCECSLVEAMAEPTALSSEPDEGGITLDDQVNFPILGLLTSLTAHHTRLYWPYRHWPIHGGPIVICGFGASRQGYDFGAPQSGRGSSLEIHSPPSAYAVANLLLSSWYWGDGDGCSKANAARAWLCDRFACAIQLVRQGAEASFDRAVAVSQDGTRVVQADFVVIANGEGAKGYSFDCGAHFCQSKLLLATEYQDLDTCDHDIGTDRAAHMQMALRLLHLRRCGQMLVTFVGLRDGRTITVLATEPRYCPTPLPNTPPNHTPVP